MKSTLKLGKIVFFLFFCTSMYGQNKYGFLKPTVTPFVIKDLSEDSNLNWSTTTLLTPNTYFYLYRTDSSKFEIGVTAYKYFGKMKTDPSLSTFLNFIDSSKIIQFDSLSKEEKKKRITNVLDKHLELWRKWRKLRNDGQYNMRVLLFIEGTFSKMREELIKYWVRFKDEQLLVKYFEILNCCTGDDGLDSRAVGSLFCLAPEDFCKVLNKQPKKTREDIVLRLASGGINYHITYNTENSQDMDKSVEEYKVLLFSLVK